MTVDIAVPEHPEPVPVTVYVLVEAGVASAVLAPVDVAPADHVYVVAPLAVRCAVWPTQINGELTVIASIFEIVTVATAVPEQPAALLPVTV